MYLSLPFDVLVVVILAIALVVIWCTIKILKISNRAVYQIITHDTNNAFL